MKQTRLLYITHPLEDYLQDSLLIGLRNNLGEDVVDYPKKEIIYSNYPEPKESLYGKGFTIWKTIDSINIDRHDIESQISRGEFTHIIFGSIWRQVDSFKNFKKLSNSKLVFVDGEDHRKLYLPALRYGNYFKRERRKVARLPIINSIGFSIPAKKIHQFALEKQKNFGIHVQCDEAYKIEEIKNNSVKSYAFTNEDEYYKDLSSSKYGITARKGGWDCMRHYEIAANGAVPCFYNYHQKPVQCAPHGLIDFKNMLTFKSANELKNKIEIVEKNGLYEELQKGSLDWAKANSSEQVARRFLESITS